MKSSILDTSARNEEAPSWAHISSMEVAFPSLLGIRLQAYAALKGHTADARLSFSQCTLAAPPD